MKTKNLITLLIILLVGTLALTACDGTLPEGIELEQYISESQNTGSGIETIPGEDLNEDINSDQAEDLSDGDQSSEGKQGQESKVTGEITELTANTITINGETFTVATGMDMTTLFTIGETYELDFYLNEDGTITLDESEFDDDDKDDDPDDSMSSQEMKFTGEVSGVTANTITINGETYTVNTIEDLTTLFMVGEIYEIEFYMNDDGTVTIDEFELEDDMHDDMSDDDNDDDIDDDSDDDMDDDSDDENNDDYDDNDNNYDNDDENDNNDDDEVDNND